MKKETNIEFQIKGIEVVEFLLIPITKSTQIIKTFNYKVNIEHRIIEDKKLFVNQVYIEILGDTENENGILLGKLKTAISFEINNFDSFIDKEKKAVNLPEDIIVTFNTMAISTTRGIMFSQFRGTYLHNAVLPVVDPKGFRKEK